MLGWVAENPPVIQKIVFQVIQMTGKLNSDQEELLFPVFGLVVFVDAGPGREMTAFETAIH